jgi:glutamate dehydrogenase/leucine dehydrogenase
VFVVVSFWTFGRVKSSKKSKFAAKRRNFINHKKTNKKHTRKTASQADFRRVASLEKLTNKKSEKNVKF